MSKKAEGPPKKNGVAASKAAAAQGAKTSEKPIHILVCTPAYGGQVAVNYVAGLLDLQKKCGERGINLSVMLENGDSLITRGRNAMATHFINHPEYTHLMWIDADIGFDGYAVIRLLDSKLPVVGGIYPLKKRFSVPEGIQETDYSVLRYVVGMEEKYEVAEPCFMTVREIGTGFMMIRREVFDLLMKLYPNRNYKSDMEHSHGEMQWNFFGTLVVEGRLLSEDYAFCYLWRRIGGKVWADTTSRLDHVGSYTYEGDWARTNAELLARSKEEQEENLEEVDDSDLAEDIEPVETIDPAALQKLLDPESNPDVKVIEVDPVEDVA